MEKLTPIVAANQSSGTEFSGRIRTAIQKSSETGRPFLVLLVQIANMKAFRNQRPTHVVNSLLREVLATIRRALHPNQYVGIFQDGVGLVFEGCDVGQADVLARKLVMLTQHVIKSGRYNDLSSRWTDIIYQFLSPNKPGIIFPCVGWSTYPRDGSLDVDLVKRAFHHINELSRQQA